MLSRAAGYHPDVMTDPLDTDPFHADRSEVSDGTDEVSALWSELTEDLLVLSDKVRGTYRRAVEESGPTEEEVRDAFRTLAGAWNQLAGSVGAAFQEPETKDHLKKAATSLVNAVGASLAELLPNRDQAGEDLASKEPPGT